MHIWLFYFRLKGQTASTQKMTDFKRPWDAYNDYLDLSKKKHPFILVLV